jgi:hypothetical protein
MPFIGYALPVVALTLLHNKKHKYIPASASASASAEYVKPNESCYITFLPCIMNRANITFLLYLIKSAILRSCLE